MATHGILVIPALVRLLAFTRWGENLQTNIVRLGIVGYTMVTIDVIVESVAHTSPLDAPPLAMAVSGVGVAALVGAAGLGVYRVLRGPTLR